MIAKRSLAVEIDRIRLRKESEEPLLVKERVGAVIRKPQKYRGEKKWAWEQLFNVESRGLPRLGVA
jgi:hypothetical protein